MNTISLRQRMMLVADQIMGDVLQLSKKAAMSDATVLICGESGTGKELIARFIHEMSERKSQPFLSVNCAAIPEGLMEAELFGYEKGAFTGAWVQRLGKFEKAMGGTLLLDEVTEMPLSLQTKLLRVIQESEIDRLGGKEPIQINTRIIATSNREPLELIKSGLFREDLYFRLNVLKIQCPPLRDRKEAISNLSRFFLDKFKDRYKKTNLDLASEAQSVLMEYHWPGNIRELSNVMERCVLLCDVHEISAELVKEGFTPKVKGNLDVQKLVSLAEVEKGHIHCTLESTDGNKTEAARQLGISVRTLRNKLRQYEMEG